MRTMRKTFLRLRSIFRHRKGISRDVTANQRARSRNPVGKAGDTLATVMSYRSCSLCHIAALGWFQTPRYPLSKYKADRDWGWRGAVSIHVQSLYNRWTGTKKLRASPRTISVAPSSSWVHNKKIWVNSMSAPGRSPGQAGCRTCAVGINMATWLEKDLKYFQIKLNYGHTIVTHTPGLQ